MQFIFLLQYEQQNPQYSFSVYSSSQRVLKSPVMYSALYQSKMPFTTLFVLVLIFFFPITTRAARINASLDREEVYAGEPVHLVITLRDAPAHQPPNLGPIPNFSVSKLGDRSMNSDFIAEINGRRIERKTFGHRYIYQLTPLTNGKLTIPPISAIVDGKSLTTSPLTLLVKPAQDYVKLEVRVTPELVFPTQPFIVSVDLLVQELPDKYDSIDPLTILHRDPPRLTIPWLEDGKLPDGIEPVNEWQSIVEPLINKKGHGIQLNNFEANSGFGGFSFPFTRSHTTTFHPEPTKISVPNDQGQDVGFWRYKLTRGFSAKTAGAFQFGQVNVNGNFPVGVRGNRSVIEQIYAIAPPLTVHIKSVPLVGRPTNFSGIVGECEMLTQVTPHEALVGAPITLTVSFRGQGALSEATAPELDQIEKIGKNFRIYEPTTELGEDQVSFTYSIRVTNEKVEEFPSLESSYFDVSQEQYASVRSKAIPLKITKAEQLESGQIVSHADPGQSTALESVASGVFANDSSLSSLRDETIRMGHWTISWGTMLGAYTVAMLLIRHQRQFHGDPLRKRRRSAAQDARTRMKLAVVATNQQTMANAVRDALVGLIAAASGRTAEGMTPRETYQQTIPLGLDESLAQQLQNLLEQCDALRYATTANEDNLSNEASRLLEDIIGAMNRKQLLR